MWAHCPLPLLSLVAGYLTTKDALSSMRLVCTDWTHVKPAWSVIWLKPKVPAPCLVDACLRSSLRRIDTEWASLLLTVGDQLGAFPFLDRIAITNDRFTCTDLESFASRHPEVCARVALDLTLGRNAAHFGKLPFPIAVFSIEHDAHFTDGDLATLVNYHFDSLRTVKLVWSCGLTDVGFKTMSMCSKLVSLSLEHQRGLTVLSAKTIGQLTSLQHLSVRRNAKLSTNTALRFYSTLVHLKTLRLGYSPCSLAGLWELPSGLRSLEVESRLVRGVTCYLNLLFKFPDMETIHRGSLLIYKKNHLGFLNDP